MCKGFWVFFQAIDYMQTKDLSPCMLIETSHHTHRTELYRGTTMVNSSAVMYCSSGCAKALCGETWPETCLELLQNILKEYMFTKQMISTVWPQNGQFCSCATQLYHCYIQTEWEAGWNMGQKQLGLCSQKECCCCIYWPYPNNSIHKMKSQDI